MDITFIRAAPVHQHSTYNSRTCSVFTRSRRGYVYVNHPKCARTPAVALAPNIGRMAAASMIVASFTLKAKGAIMYSKLLGAGALFACSLAVFTSSSRSSRGSSGGGGGGVRSKASRFASSRALWDEDGTESQKPAASSGGLYTSALSTLRTLVFSVLLPALDALRMLVADLRAYGPWGPERDSYFQPAPARTSTHTRNPDSEAHSRVHSVHTGKGRTMEERQLQALGETARVLGTAANRSAQRARNAFQSLLDGFR